MRVINIFTDASITETSYHETIGCSGAILMEDTAVCKYEISRDSTNNISEITAVKLAIELAVANKGSFDQVNIWSDSQFCIFGLTKWIRGWTDNMKNNVLMNSSRQPVKNQHIFLSIIRMIVDNNLHVNFYHIKGHVAVNSLKSIQHAVDVFNKANGSSISRESIYNMVNMNNLVDNQTRVTLDEYKDIPPISLHRGVINPVISIDDMIIYYKLVTLAGNKI